MCYCIHTSNSEYLDHDKFPEQVEVYRFDLDSRVSTGRETARTIIARPAGLPALYGFFDTDVSDHLRSDYPSRLESPSKSHASIGSPFVSGAFEPCQFLPKGMESRGEIKDSSLFLISVARERVIVPTILKRPNSDNWQRDTTEVLIVGDIDPTNIRRIRPATDFRRK